MRNLLNSCLLKYLRHVPSIIVLTAATTLSASVTEHARKAIPIQLHLGEGISINPGLSGSWANEAIPGQGIFLDVDPSAQVVFMAWFTYGNADPDGNSIVGHPTNRWYVAVGNYNEGSSEVELVLSETEGGAFDKPGGVIEIEVGSLTLIFDSCTQAAMDFDFNNELGAGHIDLTRLTPATTCESLSAP